MSYKPNYEQFRISIKIPRGEHTDSVADSTRIQKMRARDEEKLGPEREKRKNLHGTIVDLIEKGEPTQKIQTIVEREFPDIDSEMIKNYIQNWINKKQQAQKRCDALWEKVERGETTLKGAKRSINNLSFNDVLFKRILKSCFESKENDWEEER